MSMDLPHSLRCINMKDPSAKLRLTNANISLDERLVCGRRDRTRGCGNWAQSCRAATANISELCSLLDAPETDRSFRQAATEILCREQTIRFALLGREWAWGSTAS